jgi:predicted helicase
MTSLFSDFYRSLDPDPGIRGRQFEHFVKWFLTADPEWSTQVDQVWLWHEYPDRWGADCGIDLVFRHRNGEHWAVQAKCYSPDHDITKHDVDKFLSESNRPGIAHRLLIATTDRIGTNARQVCDAQEKPVVRFLLSDFEKSALEYPSDFDSLPQAKRKPRPQPREHQREAIDAVVQGFETAERGQLIMACGTGKTYVTLWVREQLAAQRTLVMVPSLGLLAQILREWTFAASIPFEVLCVCSDQTVGARGSDEAIHSVADLAFPVTSDAAEVKRFLGDEGSRVVFSTYQSSVVIAAAQADAGVPAFDLVVADEAHRCAGKAGSDFTAILDNALIRSTRRLFATATPRTYSSTVHKAAEDRGVEVVGMDNAALFGDVLYALPFGQAIERKLLTDYRVVIIGVDDPTIAQWIANRELVSTGTGIETDGESLAAQIGLLKAIKDYDLKRIISFHSCVNRAEAFSSDMRQVMAWISDEHRPSDSLRTDFVSGNMPASKRKLKLDQLKALSADERGVLSNARCLSEGVDVPSLDGVAFIDPRSSQVDIIQAVGRAIRLSPNKKAGTIILPVFIKAGEDAISTIEASNFKPVWDVLNALKAHDDVLACELDQLRTDLGRKPGSGVSADGLRKVAVELPAHVEKSIGGVLRTHLVERATESWNFWFGLLEAFVEREGHARVALDHVTKSGYPRRAAIREYLASACETESKESKGPCSN